jgi:soluble lytic murein transglycosylase-like protein
VGSERNAWEPIAREIAQQVGIDCDVFASLINVESGFNPNALGDDGSSGIAQIQPSFHAVNVWDPYASLWYSARLLRSYVESFGRYDLALAAYNVGSPTIASLGRIPLNGKTELFVARILSDAIGMRTVLTCSAPAITPEMPESDTLSVWLSLAVALADR